MSENFPFIVLLSQPYCLASSQELAALPGSTARARSLILFSWNNHRLIPLSILIHSPGIFSPCFHLWCRVDSWATEPSAALSACTPFRSLSSPRTTLTMASLAAIWALCCVAALEVPCAHLPQMLLYRRWFCCSQARWQAAPHGQDGPLARSFQNPSSLFSASCCLQHGGLLPCSGTDHIWSAVSAVGGASAALLQATWAPEKQKLPVVLGMTVWALRAISWGSVSCSAGVSLLALCSGRDNQAEYPDLLGLYWADCGETCRWP